MKIPLMSGVYTTGQGDFAVSYPLNLEPVAQDTNIAKGYLRPASGVVTVAQGPGRDRGGIDWRGACFRVMGSRLVSIDGGDTVQDIGDVGTGGTVTIDYSFTQLAINSGDRLYYYDGSALTQVTNVNLGSVLDMIWVDGYFMTTDGNFVIVTELADPFTIKPLKYGSAEEDTDPITGLLRYRGEVYVFGRHSIQVFGNVGGNGFPFQNRRGAGISVGCVGARAKCLYGDTFAFVGSAENEALGVYLAAPGNASKISTRRIDDELAKVANPSSIEVENRTYRDEQRLLVHLPDSTWVYCAEASRKTGEKVWYQASSGDDLYRPRNAILSNGRWLVGDASSNAIGRLDDGVMGHFGVNVPWQFETTLIYNEARGGIIHNVELIGATGAAAAGGGSSAMLSFTNDGQTWSAERSVVTGRAGQRTGRVAWRPHRRFRRFTGMRLRGLDTALPTWTALEAEVEGLGV